VFAEFITARAVATDCIVFVGFFFSLLARYLMNRYTQLDEISTLTTARTLLNFNVIAQRSRSRGFFRVFLCAWCCGYPRTVLSLEQGL